MELITILSDTLWDIVQDEKLYKEIIAHSAVREVELEEEEILMFARRYLAYRRKLGHKGVRLIVKGSSGWHTAREITDYIKRVFCVEHGFEFNKVSINEFFKPVVYFKFPTLSKVFHKLEDINEYYKYFEIVKEDAYPQQTMAFIDLYWEEGFKTRGNMPYLIDDPLLKAFTIQILAKLREFKVSKKLFIREFFEYWSFMGGWPSPKFLIHADSLRLLDKLSRDINPTVSKAKGVYVKVLRNGNDRDQ